MRTVTPEMASGQKLVAQARSLATANSAIVHRSQSTKVATEVRGLHRSYFRNSPHMVRRAIILAFVVAATASTHAQSWGFADLHAHPATHLAFGGDASGRTGILFGLPFGPAALETRLASCDPSTHATGDKDPGRRATRMMMVSTAAEQGQRPHGAHGAPSFLHWPDAKDVIHQQMAVEWLRRSHEGGLRLMVASATDNEIVDRIYSRATTSGAPPLTPDPTWSLTTVQQQFQFIRDLAAANATWLEVVTTPDDGRRAIREGKLALVLGAEVDMLTVPQAMTLAAEGMRVLTPIHMTNNGFGGAAIYSDFFNTLQMFYNTQTNTPTTGSMFGPVFDPAISFRLSSDAPTFIYHLNGHDIRNALGPAKVLLDFLSPFVKLITLAIGGPVERAIADILLAVEANASLMVPIPMTLLDRWPVSLLGLPAASPPLTYQCAFSLALPAGDGRPAGCPGHRNFRGLLDRPGLESLMRAGVLIDLAHMSQQSMVDTLDLAESLNGCPVFNSHTGLRRDTWDPDKSERDMRHSEARRIGALEGVIGLGTRGRLSAQPAFHLVGGGKTNGGFLKLDAGHTWTRPFWLAGDDQTGERGPAVSFRDLSIRVRTGDDDLRCNNTASLRVVDANGAQIATCALNGDAGWASGSEHTVSCRMPRQIASGGSAAAANRLGGFSLRHESVPSCGGQSSPDNWDVRELTVSARVIGSPDQHVPIFNRRGEPYVQLSNSRRSHLMRLPANVSTLGEITGFRVETMTTDDDLGTSRPASVAFRFNGGLEHKVLINGGAPLGEWRIVSNAFLFRDQRASRVNTMPIGSLESITARIADPFEGERRLLDELPTDFDNWTARINVWAQTATGERPFLVGDASTLRFTFDERSAALYRKSGRTPGPVDGVRVTFSLRDKDVAGDALHFGVRYVDPATGAMREMSAPAGARAETLGKGTTRQIVIPLLNRSARSTEWYQLREFSVHARAEVALDELFVETVRDPAATWAEDYREAKALLRGRAGSVAFGTDMNGLSDQVGFTTTAVNYPYDPATAARRPDPSRRASSAMPRPTAGSVALDVRSRGITHVGVLPDFAYATSTTSTTDSIGPDLYQSADAFLRMWERASNPARCGRPR